jgi:phosphate transport system permease protein
MSAAAGSIRRGRPRGLWAGRIFLGFLVTSLAIGFLTLGALLAQVFLEGYKWVDAVLFFEPPSADPLISGARPAILATIYLGIIIIALSVPLGVGTAIYLEEYANRDRWYNRMLEVNIQNLAAVPSIVYGILGLAFLVRGIGLGRVLLVGGMILTLLVLPTVIIAAREAIRAVPDSIRQGAYALGSTKWQVVWRQVLPASIPGIPRRCCSSERSRTSRSTRQSWATSPPFPCRSISGSPVPRRSSGRWPRRGSSSSSRSF